jgi:hypothetical protein
MYDGLKEGGIGATCNTRGEIGNACNITAGKPQGRYKA